MPIHPVSIIHLQTDEYPFPLDALQKSPQLAILLDRPTPAKVAQDADANARFLLPRDRLVDGHTAAQVNVVVDDRNALPGEALPSVMKKVIEAARPGATRKSP